jgi:hypothetical protein
MQTFLPYASFTHSARCLDRKRLGKQRVETKQLLLALGVPVGDHQPTKSAWSHHPAARMWRGHEVALAGYGMVMCCEWRSRGYRDTLFDQFVAVRQAIFDAAVVSRADILGWRLPNWLGYESFHASHRSNLLRKDYGHYCQFGWHEPSDLSYVWPVEKEVMA